MRKGNRGGSVHLLYLGLGLPYIGFGCNTLRERLLLLWRLTLSAGIALGESIKDCWKWPTRTEGLSRWQLDVALSLTNCCALSSRQELGIPTGKETQDMSLSLCPRPVSHSQRRNEVERIVQRPSDKYSLDFGIRLMLTRK